MLESVVTKGKADSLGLMITRADGSTEMIGVLSGGRWYERLAGRLRVYRSNLRAIRRATPEERRNIFKCYMNQWRNR